MFQTAFQYSVESFVCHSINDQLIETLTNDRNRCSLNEQLRSMLYYNFAEPVEKFYRDVHIIRKIVKRRANLRDSEKIKYRRHQ